MKEDANMDKLVTCDDIEDPKAINISDPGGAGVSTTTLKDAFNAYAIDGMVPVYKLLDVINTDGVIVNHEDLMGAINCIRDHELDDQNEGAVFTMGEVLELMRYINSGKSSPESSDRQMNENGGEQFGARSRRWYRELRAFFRRGCRRRTAIKDEIAHGLKPTTKLIILILIMSFITSLAVAGTAVGLGWSSQMTQATDSLDKELLLVINAAEITTIQSEKKEERAQYDAVRMIAQSIHDVGYQLFLESVTKAQLTTAKVGAMMVDNINDISAKNTMLMMAQNMGGWMDELCSMGMITTLPSMISAINYNRIPKDHDMIVVWKDANNKPVLINPELKFRDRCPATGCNLTQYQSDQITRALNGESGFYRTQDYTNWGVYGGYTYLPNCQYGILYQARTTGLRDLFMNQTIGAVNVLNTNMEGTTEIMIQQIETPGVSLTKLKMPDQCFNHTCGIDPAAASALSAMLVNGTAVVMDKDYRGTVDVLASGYVINSMNGSFMIKMDVDEIISGLVAPLRVAGTNVNHLLNGTVELLLGRPITVDGTLTFEYLGQRRFEDQCPASGCLLDESMKLAARDCMTGFGKFKDYRNKTVIASYTCVRELSLGIILKTDLDEVRDTSIAQVVEYSNLQNKEEKASLELLVARQTVSTTGQKKTVTLSNLKIAASVEEEEIYKDKAATSEAMYLALNKQLSGALRSTLDYRGNRVMSTYAYYPTLGLGFVLKIDAVEMEKPLIIQLIIVLFTAVGIALVAVLVVGVAMKVLLNSIEATWEKAKQSVQEQKENFQKLVSALYPRFASDRLLAGEQLIVMELGSSTIFFSDIVAFSTMANRLTAQEIIAWIAYVFGAMDHIADHFSVYKVKTIGDSYFAMAGLPGLIPDSEKDEHTMRMVRFASTCVQIFSGRYIHPDTGSCLRMIAAQNVLIRKEQKNALRRRSHPSSGPDMESNTNTESTNTRGGNSQCDMRYGIASGPVTVGVLPGKCPAFDVWGKTVNLASRMEGTGRANVIQCSEAVYKTVMAHPDNLFSFDDPHNTYAKGFGNVPAYFIRSTKEPPPKKLVAELMLENVFDEFYFNLDGTTANRKAVRMGGAAGGDPRFLNPAVASRMLVVSHANSNNSLSKLRPVPSAESNHMPIPSTTPDQQHQHGIPNGIPMQVPGQNRPISAGRRSVEMAPAMVIHDPGMNMMGAAMGNGGGGTHYNIGEISEEAVSPISGRAGNPEWGPGGK